ncbi:MAG: molybdenum cofactor guanylyltransferase [Nitrospirota bacterium]
MTGAILSGGLSTRMGQPKEGILLSDGRPMIAHVMAPLLEVCEKIVIIGNCRGVNLPSLPQLIALPDEAPGMGPLYAIATLLKSEIDLHGYMVTACDQPFLTAALLRRLIRAESIGPCIFQRSVSTMLTPLPGYYPACWLPEIQKQLLLGERSLCRAIQNSTPSFLPLSDTEEPLLRNINTPDDLKGIYAAFSQ